jgi:hypothetical protein
LKEKSREKCRKYKDQTKGWKGLKVDEEKEQKKEEKEKEEQTEKVEQGGAERRGGGGEGDLQAFKISSSFFLLCFFRPSLLEAELALLLLLLLRLLRLLFSPLILLRLENMQAKTLGGRKGNERWHS